MTMPPAGMTTPAVSRRHQPERVFTFARHTSPDTIIPAPINRHSGPDTVIPAPIPSFRRKPESIVANTTAVKADYDAGFRRKPE